MLESTRQRRGAAARSQGCVEKPLSQRSIDERKAPEIFFLEEPLLRVHAVTNPVVGDLRACLVLGQLLMEGAPKHLALRLKAMKRSSVLPVHCLKSCQRGQPHKGRLPSLPPLQVRFVLHAKVLEKVAFLAEHPLSLAHINAALDSLLQSAELLQHILNLQCVAFLPPPGFLPCHAHHFPALEVAQHRPQPFHLVLARFYRVRYFLSASPAISNAMNRSRLPLVLHVQEAPQARELSAHVQAQVFVGPFKH
mmetsp:Transcript_16644/g.63294  ORF Transcript_16644/g.63294 Transcript_16644/m.63294 type:complete len:251 (-) Transcript_16644:1065-1817(-)